MLHYININIIIIKSELIDTPTENNLKIKNYKTTIKQIAEYWVENSDVSEIALINLNIYYNPKHVDYYQNFHMGNYQWCYNYLMENRHLLTIHHTPKEQRDIAERMIKNSDVIFLIFIKYYYICLT